MSREWQLVRCGAMLWRYTYTHIVAITLFIGVIVVPQNVSWEIVNSLYLVVTWRLPREPNNITDYIDHYIVELEDEVNGERTQLILTTSNASISLDNLTLNNVYTVKVAVFTDYLNPFSEEVTISTYLTGRSNSSTLYMQIFLSTNSISYWSNRICTVSVINQVVMDTSNSSLSKRPQRFIHHCYHITSN